MDLTQFQSLFWEIHLLEVWEQYLTKVNRRCPTNDVWMYARHTRKKLDRLYRQFNMEFSDCALGEPININDIVGEAINQRLQIQLWEMLPRPCESPDYFVFRNRMLTPFGWESMPPAEEA